VHYPDDNHKPEMAISLGEFEALCGLAPKETIINNLMKFINFAFILETLLSLNYLARRFGINLFKLTIFLQ
jgi:mannose-6-phosphate isomerase